MKRWTNYSDMEFEVMKKALDKTLESLLNQQIITVHYAAIDYFDNKIYWDQGKIHEIEHGVEFTTASGDVYQISWDDYENDYGVNVARKEILHFWNDAKVWNVTEREEWKDIINQEIREIKTFWHEWNNESSLQDIEFEFSNNKKVWFCASRYDDKKDELLGGSDDISIVFEEPTAFKYKTGNYSNDKNLKVENYKK